MKTLRLYGAGLLVALLLTLAACLPGGISGSGIGETWTQRTSTLLVGDNLASVTYGNGTFVAVGDDGAILTSPDGVSWTRRTSLVSERTSPVSKILNGVTYGNGIFVAVGNLTTILTSRDGKFWTLRATPLGGHLLGVTYGDFKFVAVGGFPGIGTILTSP